MKTINRMPLTTVAAKEERDALSLTLAQQLSDAIDAFMDGPNDKRFPRERCVGLEAAHAELVAAYNL